MVSYRSTESGMERALDGLRAIRACIMQNAPKAADGDLWKPYDGWLKQLDRDIEKATRWLEFGKKGANLGDGSG